MSADAVLRRCARAGVAVWNDGGQLRYRVLDGAGLPADLADDLRRHKAELCALLNGRPEPRPGHCWTCGGPVLGWPDALYANCGDCVLAAAERILGGLRGRETR